MSLSEQFTVTYIWWLLRTPKVRYLIEGKDEAPEYDASQNSFAGMDLEERFIVSDASAQYPDNFNVIKMQK